MIDIHSHILWGLDDGARTIQDSTAMLAMAAEGGTTDIVATPHANMMYRFEPETVKQRIAELAEASGGRPAIHYGCDFHLSFDNIQDALENPSRYTVNCGQYLMVEFPDRTVPHGMNKALEALIRKGIAPVITHPERHPVLGRDGAIQEWVEAGCLVQVTAGSLLGRFGAEAERSGWEMLRRGLAHFVASDAHGTRDRTTRLDTAFTAVAERLGEEFAAQVFEEFPHAVIAKAPLPERKPPRSRKKWPLFGR
jgi:protein-tyrosine phosphatase